MTETENQVSSILTSQYLNNTLNNIQFRLDYTLDSHNQESFTTSQNAITIDWLDKNLYELTVNQLFLTSSKIEFRSSAKSRKIIQINPKLNQTNQLDKYTWQLLAWLKALPLNQDYAINFSIDCHVFYIIEYIQILKNWIESEQFKGKILLVIPSNILSTYPDSFAPFIQIKETQSKNHEIADKWKKLGFTEKAIYVTTCFMQGLSLHQFRQVLVQILKVKDLQEEKDKTDRKMQGFYIVKWEKNYDQLLKECHLTIIKQAGQPAHVGFVEISELWLYTQFIQEEYPIFLQEFFEMLLYAIFPKLCQDYHDILKLSISMYARLASHYQDYSKNVRPVELLAKLLEKTEEDTAKENLTALLVNEIYLHKSIAHQANYLFNLVAHQPSIELQLLLAISSQSSGQSITFCLPIWLNLLKNQDKVIQNKAFEPLLEYTSKNISQATQIFRSIENSGINVTFFTEKEVEQQVSLFDLFMVYFSLNNICEVYNYSGGTIPKNLLLAQNLSFDNQVSDFFKKLLENLLSFSLPQQNLENTLKTVALIIVEWYISLHYISIKAFEETFKEESFKLLKKVNNLPQLQHRLTKKKLLTTWQQLAQDLLEKVKEIPHAEHQQLMALNTKRKIMMKLINNFRNL